MNVSYNQRWTIAPIYQPPPLDVPLFTKREMLAIGVVLLLFLAASVIAAWSFAALMSPLDMGGLPS